MRNTHLTGLRNERFPTLNSMGVSDADVLAYQPLMIISVGDRASLEGHGLEFIAANGYEVIPDA